MTYVQTYTVRVVDTETSQCDFPGIDYGRKTLFLVAWLPQGIIVRQKAYSQYGGRFSPKNYTPGHLLFLKWDRKKHFLQEEEIPYGRAYERTLQEMLARHTKKRRVR